MPEYVAVPVAVPTDALDVVMVFEVVVVEVVVVLVVPPVAVVVLVLLVLVLVVLVVVVVVTYSLLQLSVHYSRRFPPSADVTHLAVRKALRVVRILFDAGGPRGTAGSPSPVYTAALAPIIKSRKSTHRGSKSG